MKPCSVRIISHFGTVTIQVLTTDELFDTIKSVVEDYACTRLLKHERMPLSPSMCVRYMGIGRGQDFLDAEAKEIADLLVEAGINRDQIQISNLFVEGIDRDQTQIS